MDDPYILCQTGLSYERAALQQHIETHGTDPETGAPLTNTVMAPNAVLRQFINHSRATLLSIPYPPPGMAGNQPDGGAPEDADAAPADP